MYCLIQARPLGQQKQSRTFLTVSSRPGCAANPSWYTCMICHHVPSSGGMIVLQFMSSQRPQSSVHRWCSRLASNHGWYCQRAFANTPLSEVGSPTSAKLRNALSGRSDSCRSPSSHSSSHRQDSASAGVLFFPATWRILKL